MYYKGVLKKMTTERSFTTQYYLLFENDYINVNQLIDREIKISLEGYQCLNCGSEEPIFRQGHCKKCFFESPATADWVIRPELSKAHLNVEDRDLDYEKSVQLQPHIVYLSLSSNAKVGVTRKTQIPTRWIDQGATEAIIIAETPNRYLAGVIEVALKEHVSDKTYWKKMLEGTTEKVDLNDIKKNLLKYIPKEGIPYVINEETTPFTIDYPITQEIVVKKSLNLDKTPSYSGELAGIKGQYLLFKDGTVFNVRSNEGYKVQIEIS